MLFFLALFKPNCLWFKSYKPPQVQEDVANDNGSSTAVVKEEKSEEKLEVKTEAPCLQRANSISPLGSQQFVNLIWDWVLGLSSSY